MDELTHCPAQPAPKSAQVDKRTGRPIAAYPKHETWVERYVEQFSRALGLRRAPTHLGGEIKDL